ncbi:TonB-dependent receptor [Pedobacter gandavensis]|uniref:SusC/RagA family TonB-linked outer membrane protein n=1 Tax=Pedobacter gandavensis TaxID=2679963 RepID=UPI00292F9B84|nr:TonB-dependent receptor [Pedobacter gandavensis]
MRIYYLLLGAVLAGTGAVHAENYGAPLGKIGLNFPDHPNRLNLKFLTVSGYVKDELGMAMPGVSVKVKGTSKGAVTNNKGYYSLDVQPTDELEFIFVGYKTYTISVRNQVDINVVLEPEAGNLNEIAVVGYGRQKKASLVGSQSTLKAEELKLPVRDLTNAIAGRLAGVVAYQRGGAPGSDGSDIFIRGISTFGSSPRSPLLVVDGVPDRSINNIDPEDIESFTVLKDASATAVYGTRGANGVILINTKKGKIGKPSVNAEFNQAINKFTALPEFLDAPDFMTIFNEGLTMRGRAPQYTQEAIDKSISGADPDLNPNVKWYDELFNDFGHSQRATLNVGGGSENATYYLSAGYYGEKGLFKTDDVQSYNSSLKLDRFNFTSNLNLNLTKSTKLDFGINGFITSYNEPNYGVNDLFALATSTPPHTIPTRYSNGQWPQLAGSGFSPYMALTQSGVYSAFNNVVRSNIKLSQDLSAFTEGLSFSAMFAYDVNSSMATRRGRTLQTYKPRDGGRDANGNLLTEISFAGNNDLSFAISRFGDRRLYVESALNYSRKFGKSEVGGLVLFNQSDFSDAQSRVDAAGYKGAIPYRQRNLVGRATYGYNDRYFVEGNFSYSGSDNFIPNKRYGFFPSIGAGWIVSNEKFFEPLSKIVSHFKLRYTYGVSGNAALLDPTLRFLYLTTIGNGGTYGFGDTPSSVTGYAETRIGGNVQWENSYRQNLGLELNFLDNNLELIVELFNEKRKNILVPNLNIPYNSGFTPSNLPFSNVGEVSNKGIDATLSYTKNFAERSFISFRGVFNYNKNLNIIDGNAPWKYPYNDRVGKPIGQRFGYIATGLFQSQSEIDNAASQAGNTMIGDIRYKDLDGNGIINGDDQTAIGYGAVPRIVYGLNLAGGYKGFDIALFFQGAGQVDFNYASGDATTPFTKGPTNSNMYVKVLDRWTPDNPNPRPFYPRLSTTQDLTTNYLTSTWWIQRADYLRLKSAEIGYTFNPKLFEKAGIKKVRIYTNGTNLLTLSRWKFWDPELGDGRGATYPNISTYNVGLRVNFQ